MSRYENYEIKNNVFGTLSAPISSLATTIQLGDGQGQRFSENMLATLENIENGKVMKREIVLITAINGDTLTVTRKYAPCPDNDEANTQGQVSYAFSTDDTISAYIDKEHFDEIKKSINDIYENGLDKLRTDVVSGLQISVSAGPVLVGSAYYDFAGDNITLTDNATNYVEIDEDGFLVSNTTDWGDKHTKIAKVITSGGTVTSIEDWRLGTVGGEIGGVNIHDLTEKASLSPDDEFIIADSDNIYNNKKVKASNIIGYDRKICIEAINQGDIVSIKSYDFGGATENINLGKDYNTAVAGEIYGSGIESDQIKLRLAKNGNGQDITVRIETDNNGLPSGTLADNNAIGTVLSSGITTTLTEYVCQFAGEFSLDKYTKYRIVVSVQSLDANNYSIIGGNNIYITQNYMYYNNGRTDKDGGYTKTGFTGLQSGGYSTFNSAVWTIVFNKDIYLNQFSLRSLTGLTIVHNGDTIYTGNGQNININFVQGETYIFNVSHSSNERYYTSQTQSCDICTSISCDHGVIYGNSGVNFFYYLDTFTNQKNINMSTNLAEEFLLKIDTTKDYTISNRIGIATTTKNKGEILGIAMNGGIAGNDNWNLSLGQQYYYKNNTITTETSNIYLGYAISDTQIKVNASLVGFVEITKTISVSARYNTQTSAEFSFDNDGIFIVNITGEQLTSYSNIPQVGRVLKDGIIIAEQSLEYMVSGGGFATLTIPFVRGAKYSLQAYSNGNLTTTMSLGKIYAIN